MWRAGRKQNCHCSSSPPLSRNCLRTHPRVCRTKHNIRPGVTVRPKKSSIRDNRLLYRMCRQSTRSLRDQWQRRSKRRVSCSTVNRRLLSRGLHSRRPAKKPLLTRKRKTSRLEWARQHQHRRLRHWRHILFSDESGYLLHLASGRVCVRRAAGGQRFQEDCVLPTVAHGGGSVHVWGAIHYDGRTNLVILERKITADTYRQLLETEVLPYARRHFGRKFSVPT